jgi:hypothetical protein
MDFDLRPLGTEPRGSWRAALAFLPYYPRSSRILIRKLKRASSRCGGMPNELRR